MGNTVEEDERGQQTGSIPEAFKSRKQKILAELSVPDENYTDLSPKGSVDEGIRDLINDINALPGLVTTSSCAGRISVFLEGRKTKKKQQQSQLQSQSTQQQRVFAQSGGKGAGKWLFVSHDPLTSYMSASGSGPASSHRKDDDAVQPSLCGLFGMIAGGDGKPPGWEGKEGQSSPRLVRFHFEPLVGLIVLLWV